MTTDRYRMEPLPWDDERGNEFAIYEGNIYVGVIRREKEAKIALAALNNQLTDWPVFAGMLLRNDPAELRASLDDVLGPE